MPSGLRTCSSPCSIRSPPSSSASLRRPPRAEVLDGTEVNLASLKGKPILLVFWASWSSDSLALLPLAKLEAQCQERGIALYSVSVGEDAEVVRKALTSAKLRLPVLLDSKDLTAASFGIRRCHDRRHRP